MKYKFVRKGKTLSSEDIKGTMDFDKMAAGSGLLTGSKMASAVLKGASLGKVALISVIIIGIVATSSYLANPEYTEAQFNDLILNQFMPKEKQEEVKSNVNPEPSTKTSIPVNPIDEVVDEEEPEISIVEEEDAEEQRANSLLLYEDLLVRAKPLPTTKIFLNYIDKELEYPVEALSDSIEGYVEVFFKVNKRGETEDFKISKSLGEAFDNEAIRVIKNYRNWKPAVYLGEAQEDFLKLKVTFTLQTNHSSGNH